MKRKVEEAFITSKGYLYEIEMGSHQLNVANVIIANKLSIKNGSLKHLHHDHSELNEEEIWDLIDEQYGKLCIKYCDGKAFSMVGIDVWKKVLKDEKLISIHSFDGGRGLGCVVIEHKATKRQFCKAKQLWKQGRIKLNVYHEILKSYKSNIDKVNEKPEIVEYEFLDEIYEHIKEGDYFKLHDDINSRKYATLRVWIDDSVYIVNENSLNDDCKINDDEKDPLYLNKWGAITLCNSKGENIKTYISNQRIYKNRRPRLNWEAAMEVGD